MGRTYRRRIGIALVILLAAGVVCTLGILVYLERLRGLASALITSAYEIQTKADADREIAAWSKRFGKDFWEESDHPGGDHNYDAQIVNLTLARFHIVQPTGVTVGITVRGGQLRSVAVIESTGWYPVASVWVQEWFDEEMPRRIRVVGNRRPYAARVEFPASLPEDQRKKAFALNTKCLVSPRICKNEEEILPEISQLESAERQESQRTLLLEVVLTTYDVYRTETLLYLRVFSNGSAEAHPMREVDFRKLALKTASIPPSELAALGEFLGSSNVQHLDAKYARYWGNIDFGQTWQITIAQGGSQKTMVLENFQPFLARARKKPYPAELEKLGCLVWKLRTKVTGEALEQNYVAGCQKLGY